MSTSPSAARPSVFASVRAGLSALLRAPRALLLLLAAQAVMSLLLALGRMLPDAGIAPRALFFGLLFVLDAASELVAVSALCFAHETLVLGKPARAAAFALPCARARHGVPSAALTLALIVLAKNCLTFLCNAALSAGAWLPPPLSLLCVILGTLGIGLFMLAFTLHMRAALAFSSNIRGFFALLRDLKRCLPALLRFVLLCIPVLVPFLNLIQSLYDAPRSFISQFCFLLLLGAIQLLSYAALPFLYRGRVPLADN